MKQASPLILFLIASVFAATPPPALLAQPVSVSPDYRLGASDQIEVTVAGLPELSARIRVAQDGTASLPLIGAIRVEGLTTAEAAKLIAAHYTGGGYANAAQVRVEIVAFESRQASVLGQVNAQGMIALDRTYTLAEVLARAGGIKDDAADSVVITRPAGQGYSERLTIDLSRMVDGRGAPLTIRPGDVVYVPKAPTISVLGAVNRAGNYRLTQNMTVQQALAAAGDVARIGTRSRLRIRRTDDKNVTTVIPVKLDDRVLAGDTILVRERIF